MANESDGGLSSKLQTFQSISSPPSKRNTKNLSLKLNPHPNTKGSTAPSNNTTDNQRNPFIRSPTTSSKPVFTNDTSPSSPATGVRLFRHPSLPLKNKSFGNTNSTTNKNNTNPSSEGGLKRRTTLSLSIPLESETQKYSSSSSSSSKLSSGSIPSLNSSLSPIATLSPPSFTQPVSATSPKFLHSMNNSTSTHSSSSTFRGSNMDESDGHLKTQTLIRNLSNIDISDDGDNSKLNAYPDGPKCVYDSNLYLYSEPSLQEIEQFDIVINVAKELIPPFLSIDELNDSFQSNKGEILALTHTASSTSKVIDYYYVPWTHTSKICKELPTLTNLIIGSLNQGRKLLIHCQCGVSRSASLIVAFLMKFKNLNLNDSYSLLKVQAPDISPNMSLIFQLMEWGELIGVDRIVTTPQYELDMKKLNELHQ